MRKFIVLAVVALALALTVSATSAGGGKWVNSQRLALYPVLSCSSNFPDTSQPGQGTAKLVDPMGDVNLIIQGNAKGLTADSGYDVWVRNLDTYGGYTGPKLAYYAPLGYYKLATFTTDSEGNGSFHLNLRADHLPPGEYQIQVAINPLSNQGCTVLATAWDYANNLGTTVTV